MFLPIGRHVAEVLLRHPHPQPPVQCAGDDADENDVANPDLRDPANGERFGSGEIGCSELPDPHATINMNARALQRRPGAHQMHADLDRIQRAVEGSLSQRKFGRSANGLLRCPIGRERYLRRMDLSAARVLITGASQVSVGDRPHTQVGERSSGRPQ